MRYEFVITKDFSLLDNEEICKNMNKSIKTVFFEIPKFPEYFLVEWIEAIPYVSQIGIWNKKKNKIQQYAKWLKKNKDNFNLFNPTISHSLIYTNPYTRKQKIFNFRSFKNSCTISKNLFSKKIEIPDCDVIFPYDSKIHLIYKNSGEYHYRQICTLMDYLNFCVVNEKLKCNFSEKEKIVLYLGCQDFFHKSEQKFNILSPKGGDKITTIFKDEIHILEKKEFYVFQSNLIMDMIENGDQIDIFSNIDFFNFQKCQSVWWRSNDLENLLFLHKIGAIQFYLRFLDLENKLYQIISSRPDSTLDIQKLSELLFFLV